jgi:hypothetical protein
LRAPGLARNPTRRERFEAGDRAPDRGIELETRLALLESLAKEWIKAATEKDPDAAEAVNHYRSELERVSGLCQLGECHR